MKKIKTVYLFNLLWLLGLLQIGDYGSQPYPHYIFDTMIQPDFHAVVMTCGIYSIYFISGNLLRLTYFWRSSPYWAYIALSAILIFQCFAAFWALCMRRPTGAR